MNISEEKEKELGKRVIKEVIGICNLHKIDYLTLPRAMKDALMDCFQLGVIISKEIVNEVYDESEKKNGN